MRLLEDSLMRLHGCAALIEVSAKEGGSIELAIVTFVGTDLVK